MPVPAVVLVLNAVGNSSVKLMNPSWPEVPLMLRPRHCRMEMPAAVRAVPDDVPFAAAAVIEVVRLVCTKPMICVGLLMANVDVVPVPGFVAGVAEIRAMICPGV